MGEFLDAKIKNNPKIFQDPANPTPADFKAAKGIMDGAEKLGEKKLGPGRPRRSTSKPVCGSRCPKSARP